MNNNGYRIVVDAGHGGSDPGAVSGNLREKDFNLEAANYMYNRFKELGVPVAITRDSDETLSRTERLNTMTNTFGNDSKVIVLSNHINAGGGEGAEIVYPLRTSSVLPRAILDEIGARGQIKRKIYQRVLPEDSTKDYYYIMRQTPNTTALLIEYGFIDNARDQAKLQNNLLDYAEGVVKAVSEYIGVPYTAPGGETVNGDTYTVKRGDTLYSIALKLNTTVDELKRVNNLTSNNLSVGQVLQIPPKEIEEEYELYTVQSGDTLYRIANTYNIPVNDIIDYNDLETTVLTVGQTLRIPKSGVVGDDNMDNNIYIVKAGDTLYSIAQTYGMSVDELKTLNNLSSNVLSIGQELIVGRDGIEENEYIVYQIEPGDTLYSIARRYNTKVDAIKAYNNLTNDILTVGSVIQIPTSTSIDTTYQNYTILSGDTLYSIARRFNTTVDAILSLNNLDSNNLQVGQTIRIPL